MMDVGTWVDRLPPRLMRAGVVAWALVGFGLVVYGALLVLRPVRLVLVAVGVGVLVAVILEPVVTRQTRAGMHRWLAATTAWAALAVPGALGLSSLVRVAWRELRTLAEDAPTLLADAGASLHDAWEQVESAGIPLPASDPGDWLERNREVVADWVSAGVGGAATVTGLVVAVLIGFVLAFPLMASLPRLRGELLALVPARRRRSMEDGMRISGEVIGRFVRGQLLIAVIVGVLSGIAMAILGVPWAIFVGTVAGVTNLVPFFGPVVGSVIGIVLALAEGGISLGVWVLLAFIAIQQFESYVLSPMIVGVAVRLPAFVVMMAVMVGAAYAGVVGMLLAAPILGTGKALYQRFRGSERDEGDGDATVPKPRQAALEEASAD